jgi:hypothetical protein
MLAQANIEPSIYSMMRCASRNGTVRRELVGRSLEHPWRFLLSVLSSVSFNPQTFNSALINRKGMNAAF